jgi:alpha-mannosidase
MDHIPEFIFAGSQALTYEFVRQKNPYLFKRIQEYQKQGRFELVGGSWVEPDCRMPSGEAFIRQRLYGQHYFLKHFSTLPQVEWTPDTFGYAWSMPQILRKSGAKYFFTTKVWECNPKYANAPWPFVNFVWRGCNGSEILTHIQPQMFGPIAAWPDSRTKSNLVKPGIQLVANYLSIHPEKAPELSAVPEDYVKELGVFAGLGDGGHGPTGKEVAQMDYWLKQGHGHYSTVHNYFEVLETYRSRLPIWADELYYQYHQGTLTTQGFVKHWIRYLEWRTAGIETMATCIEMLGGDLFPYATLTQVWLDICTNHFHDIFPGSSIAEVYDDFYDHVTQDTKLLGKVEKNILSWIARNNPWPSLNKLNNTTVKIPFTAVNLLGTKRVAIVSIDCQSNTGKSIKSAVVHTRDGELMVPAQFIPGDPQIPDPLVRIPDRVEFLLDFGEFEWITGYLTDIPCAPIETILIEETPNQEIQVRMQGIQCQISQKTGEILGCTWKDELGILRALFTGPAFSIRAFEDMQDAWEIQPNFRECPLPWELVTPPKVREHGPVRTVIEYQGRIEEGDSLFTLRYIFYAGLAEIRSEILVDWKDPGVLIKHFYPIATDAKMSHAEIPGAVITRSIFPTTPHDQARWENNCQTFVDCSHPEKTWGIAFLNDGKYGYATPDGGFELTLLRKGHLPKIANEAWCLPARREKVLRNEWVPTSTDDGWHVIRQAIVPHLGDWESSQINLRAHAFNSPICAQVIPSEIAAINTNSKRITPPPIIISNPSLEILAWKPWEPLIAQGNAGYILRIANYSHLPQSGSIIFHSGLEIHTVDPCDLLERPGQIPDESPLEFSAENRKLTTLWKSFEIRSFLLR